MDKSRESEDRSTWAIGGGLLIGIGVGFFYLQRSALVFVGCILAGLGGGLIITSLISSARKHDSR
jgi:hypothetical protein